MANIQEVLDFIKAKGAVTCKELSSRFDLTENRGRRVLGTLLHEGVVRFTTSRNSYGVYWYLDDGVPTQANPVRLRQGEPGHGTYAFGKKTGKSPRSKNRRSWTEEEFLSRFPEGNYEVYLQLEERNRREDA